MDTDRRDLTASLAATGIALGAASLVPDQAISQPIPLEPIPALPATPTPASPGDFDFLAGEWRIQNWRQKSPGDWDIFEGEATVYPILAGVGSVEELRIPARNFSGMGLRLLDRTRRVWSDHWVNAQSGVVSVPGQEGSFEAGVGIFVSRETVDGTAMTYAGIWDRITPTSCRWRQASSANGGTSWDQSWIMHWTRTGPPSAS